MKLLNFLRNYSKVALKPGQQNTIYIDKSKLDKSMHAKIPVICLLGWTGARDSHLKKYCKIYQDLGYHTVRFSPSNKLTFLQTKEHSKYARDLVKQLGDNFQNNPLMFHFFSNAGLFIHYHNIIRNLNEFPVITQNEKGQIYDSGLGWTNSYFKLIKGLSHLLESDIKFGPLRYTFAFSLSTLLEVYNRLTLNDNYFSQAFKTIINDKRKLPALYLLSNADKLINPVEIQKNIAIRVEKNSSDYYTKVKVYDDADHVLIYAKYPDDYVNQIKEHLKICNLEIKF